MQHASIQCVQFTNTCVSSKFVTRTAPNFVRVKPHLLATTMCNFIALALSETEPARI